MALRSRVPQLVVRPHDPNRARIMLVGMAIVWIVSLVAAWTLGSDHAAPGFGLLRGDIAELRKELLTATKELSETKDKLALVERSEQVSRTANESLQQTLREREDEIAGLRADLAFFQRLVGGGSAARRPLAVHSFAMRPVGQTRGYTYRLTLTQNLKKAAVSEGTVDLSVEGVRGQQVVTLPLAQLGAGQATLPFSFKYFQRLEGTVILPDGFTPDRVKLVVKSKGGEQDLRTFAWQEALSNGENADVWQ
jgi:hypothetical protein